MTDDELINALGKGVIICWGNTMAHTERQDALAHAEDLETLLGAAHKHLNSNSSSGYDLAHLILRLVPKARNALRQLGGAV